MITFTHTIADPQGIHARPAGFLVREIQKFTSAVTIEKGAKKADGKKLFNIMSLAAKCGDEIVVSIDGEDENTAASFIKEYLQTNI